MLAYNTMNELEKFKIYLIKSGRKKSTITSYCCNFKRLLTECPDLSLESIELFLIKMIENGKKETYVNDFIDTMRIYGQSISTDSYTSLKYFKEKEFIKATMSDEEIKAFLELPPPVTEIMNWKSKKIVKYHYAKGWDTWTLFFSIMAYSGMRCGEVAHLTVDRVDFGRQVFVLDDTKTNTPRYVPIAPILLEPLQKHIERLVGNNLFPSKRGGKHRQNGVVDDVDWGYNFHKRLKMLGLKRKNLTPYSLRHSFITRMLDEDVNLFKVQKIVGHRQIATTAHYTHLTTKDIVTAISKDPLSRNSLSPEQKMILGKEALERSGFFVVECREKEG